MAENEIYRACEKHLDLYIERFEPGLPLGVPDMHWVTSPWSFSKHKAGWIEAKDQAYEVRPQQAIWMRRYWSKGGSVYVLARQREEVLLIPGISIPFDRKILRRSATCFWPSLDLVEWEELRFHITTKLI